MPIDSHDYFEIFGVKLSLNLTNEELEQKLYELQSLYHPDRYVHRVASEQSIALANSAIINQGYHVLKNPLTRAHHAFQVLGMSPENRAAPIEFIEESFELHAQLEECESQKELTDFYTNILKLEESARQELITHFEKRAYQEALSVYIKLKLLESIKQSITKQLKHQDAS
ncbi:Fe-S protein assembly co-chaperone HscB [Rickettsiales endosymbiont of Peranema trichophorum]|uniref:Fe-S protein assembly co-chaperone HscB n=1 Tax=Rickettsiales endosymbiont of Peranema trichophorum TaxID=2486577 RepID=UPI0013EE454C|nr:Fe-S protein assembly co-chaperone HscB [Rickettsiales endosymbiont of Peranema trichophorum]